jgi:hypothetical protein
MIRNMIIGIFLLLVVPAAMADDDNYFSVKDNTGPYTALPGDTLAVQFTMSNRDRVYPDNVTVYIDPCPVGWKCERKTFSYHSTGVYAENLTVEIPKTASIKRYTLYILLSSEEMTRRGNDRVILDVVSEDELEVIPYDQYGQEDTSSVAKNPALEAVNYSASRRQQIVETPLPEPGEETAIIPKINTTDVVDTVERMESSSQFREYATVVLVIVLVFIAVGGFMAWRKKDGKKEKK